MIPKAFFFCGFLALMPALVHPQSRPTRYDVVPVSSIIYHRTIRLFVSTASGRQEKPAALPVVYVPGVGKEDPSYFARLDMLVQEGILPPLLVVGVESATGTPEQHTGSEEYADPKQQSAPTADAQAFYFAFIAGEAMPAIEKRYRCTPYKTLYTDGAGEFASFVLKNYPETFTTYLSLSPLALYDPATQLRYVKGTMRSGNWTPTHVEQYFPDEYALKTGRPGWIGEQR